MNINNVPFIGDSHGVSLIGRGVRISSIVLSKMIPTSAMEVSNRHIKRCMNKMLTSLWLMGPEKVKVTHVGGSIN